MSSLTDKLERKLDLAARAAWLYYIAGNTQDQVATRLEISRQAAQRLIALAVEENLVRFRLEHPVSTCMELGEALVQRHGLAFCDVVPADDGPEHIRGVAVAAAIRLENYLLQRAPLTLAFATGRTLREMVRQVAPMERSQHKLVSVVGNMTRDGRASPYEVVMRLSDKVSAQCFPLPTPVVADSAEDRALLWQQRSYQTVTELARGARATFVGVSEIAWDSPLHRDGFINDAELGELIDAGAVGEIQGWPYDDQGKLIDSDVTRRVAAIPLVVSPEQVIIAVGSGPQKVPALEAALRGGLITGLVTDEDVAGLLLQAD